MLSTNLKKTERVLQGTGLHENDNQVWDTNSEGS